MYLYVTIAHLYRSNNKMTTINLPDFSKAAILVVGDVMLDRYWFGDAARISPEAPVPVVKVKQVDDRPGGAGNVALNIAALGAKVTLLGVTGDDAAATILVEQLKANGVTSKVQHLANIPTITKLRVISRHQQLIRLDFEEKFPEFNYQGLLEEYEQALAEADLVILSDYNKGTLATPEDFISRARARNIPVLVDPKGNNFSIYNNADVITPNLKEFETIVGACQTEHELIAKAQAFLHQNKIGALLLTRGEQGMTLIQRDHEEIHLPAHAREVFDVTGAGDTVIATMGAAMAAGSSLSNSMQLANLAASMVVAKLGAVSISIAELQVAVSHSSAIKGGVLNEEQLLIAVNEVRQQNKKIVFTNGCFDILHVGHVTYLQQAKQLGDYLIVAINDDDSITRLKGPGRPINTVEQRLAVLASLGVVDWVVSFADDTPKRLLKLLQPNILVKGGDYTVDQVVGAEIVLAYGGDVRVLGVTKGISTTAIIDRMSQTVKLSQQEDVLT
jgi:D-beta-D-heptose 7-phosphate kinase/D-beta-D-heptose 1-phosphate adenosyltransferase